MRAFDRFLMMGGIGMWDVRGIGCLSSLSLSLSRSHIHGAVCFACILLTKNKPEQLSIGYLTKGLTLTLQLTALCPSLASRMKRMTRLRKNLIDLVLGAVLISEF